MDQQHGIRDSALEIRASDLATRNLSFWVSCDQGVFSSTHDIFAKQTSTHRRKPNKINWHKTRVLDWWLWSWQPKAFFFLLKKKITKTLRPKKAQRVPPATSQGVILLHSQPVKVQQQWLPGLLKQGRQGWQKGNTNFWLKKTNKKTRIHKVKPTNPNNASWLFVQWSWILGWWFNDSGSRDAGTSQGSLWVLNKGTVGWQPEIRHPPVEGMVVYPIIDRVSKTSQVVGLGISEASTVPHLFLNFAPPFPLHPLPSESSRWLQATSPFGEVPWPRSVENFLRFAWLVVSTNPFEKYAQVKLLEAIFP